MPITDLQTRALVLAKGLDPDQWDIVDETPAASTEQQPQQYGGWETAGKVFICQADLNQDKTARGVEQT